MIIGGNREEILKATALLHPQLPCGKLDHCLYR